MYYLWHLLGLKRPQGVQKPNSLPLANHSNAKGETKQTTFGHFLDDYIRQEYKVTQITQK